MAEQLELAPVEAPAPSPWDTVRARAPSKRFVREIDLDTQMQRFIEIPGTELNLFDGATVMRPSIPGGRSLQEFDTIVADYDRRWQDEEPAA